MPAVAADPPADDQIQLILQFASDPDRETRAMGLQFVREQAPGEGATLKFAGLLPKLQPEAQVDLLDALADRGDVAARPAVVEMLNSSEETVRAAALAALATLGSEADVALLAEKATSGTAREAAAARQSLIQLRGEKVNATIVDQLAQAPAELRARLLGILAARNATETLPTVIEHLQNPSPAVRSAALGALRFLGDQNHVATLVQAVRKAEDDAERREGKLALLAVCRRAKEAAAEPILAGLAEADVPARLILLESLARAGGEKALAELVARLQDDDESVRDQAVRLLATWPDAAAVEPLRKIAASGQSLRHQVLAIRGLVRLARSQAQQAAQLELLGQAMQLAKRPEEKRLVLGALGSITAEASLDVLLPALDDPALAQEAGLAVVQIAERIEDADPQKVRAALEKASQTTKSLPIRLRAQKALEALQAQKTESEG